MNNIKPILKWAGGKKALLPIIQQLLPDNIDIYCEPFIGGGAVLFNIQPKYAFVNDINPELINVYKVIKDSLEALISELITYPNSSDFYYEMRSLDRMENFKCLSPVKRAARFIYLNKTCYNGLYRENKKGYFNVPYGKYKNPKIVDSQNLINMNHYFNMSNITFSCQNFSKVLMSLPKGCFVYLDPPYDPPHDNTMFTNYTKFNFDKNDHLILRDCCDILNRNNIRFLMSNSDTEFIRSIYSDYIITQVFTKRAISCKSEDRSNSVSELLIKNY